MLVEGTKYHRNGKVYTVTQITREKCINGTTTVTLVDSCNNHNDVDLSYLMTHYSGFLPNTFVNNQPLTHDSN